MLGSTLSPAHCVKCSVSVASIDSPSAADCLNNLTSSEKMDKPCNARWSASHLVANDLSISIAMPKGIHANTDLGLDL